VTDQQERRTRRPGQTASHVQDRERGNCERASEGKAAVSSRILTKARTDRQIRRAGARSAGRHVDT
jgi:hypothetical protein